MSTSSCAWEQTFAPMRITSSCAGSRNSPAHRCVPPTFVPEPRSSTIDADIDRLTPNDFQPRVHVDDARLQELAQSIRANGVIQPIVVRKIDDRFQIIAGERRWRAAKLAGLLRVPVVVRDVAAGQEQSLLEVALIENIQREDLNPIEEAMAYRRLADQFQPHVAVNAGGQVNVSYFDRRLDARRTQLQLDRNLPIGGFADFLDLQCEIVGP